MEYTVSMKLAFCFGVKLFLERDVVLSRVVEDSKRLPVTDFPWGDTAFIAVSHFKTIPRIYPQKARKNTLMSE